MNVRHATGAFHSFSIKNIFYDKMELRLFLFSAEDPLILKNHNWVDFYINTSSTNS